MEPISQLHYPHKFINNPSHCFNRDAPHDSPPLSYYTHDMPRKTKLLPLSQENAPQNNDSRGFSQDPLPHNAQPLLQNDITDSPRPHYPQNLLASKTIPPHGFLQDPHLYRCSRDISNYNQTPRPYPVPSDVLDPNNPTSGLYSQENSLVLPRRHLKQSPSCHSLPQIPPGTHSNFHGSVHGPSFHYQSHTSPIQQRHNPKLESTGHEGNNNSRNYSPGPTYHELTPVIISRQKDIRTQIPKPTSPEGSFLSVPKAEPVNPSDTSPHRHSHQLSLNKHTVSCGKTTFPRSDTDKAIAVQSDCEAPPCPNPSTVLNGRMSSSLEKERPPISLPGKNTPSCSTANGNQNISCTPNHKNQNVVNQTLASEKTKELKSKRRTKKRVTSNQNSNSSNNKALKNSLKEGNGSFHVLKSSSIKIKHNQSKKFDYVIKQEHQDEKQRKTKVKLSNKSAKNLKLNGSLPLSKQELSRKNGKKKHSNGWSWDGTPFQKLIFLSNDNPPRFMKCFLSMRHLEGDVIRVKDCVLLKSGPKKTDLPFVAKVVDLWEDPEDGEMMMSLMWYYRPEHTEQGRRPQDMEDEIFASKHRDVNSVACIEDKCYVLTFTEYCRYRKGVKLAEEKHHPEISMVPKPEGKYPRVSRLPPEWVSSEMVFFCRKVYDFRQKRLLKNPM
ncbi:uncharacterized protein LOC106467362 [Limulus polyphemus]|uniref:Uncharacterized protein LOC106467362 n=1 Tax=Limulus polyphemus TaxID=6850 RepID=A0ABM1BJD3_LIMPO|nr:uncharacterized protein LOC106467362 [Limulus polyphemus]